MRVTCPLTENVRDEISPAGNVLKLIPGENLYMNTSKISSLLFILAISLIIPLSVHSETGLGGNADEVRYLDLKGMGLHDRALRLLATWSLRLDDPALLETNIFRMDELVRHPEQFTEALELYDKLAASEALKKNSEAAERLMLFRQELLLRMGRQAEADAIGRSLDFMNFRAIGPFPSRTAMEFGRDYPVMEALEKQAQLQGKIHPVKWFDAATDALGTTDLAELLPDTQDSFFYLHSRIHAKSPGIYRLMLGKTGFCKVSVDGMPYSETWSATASAVTSMPSRCSFRPAGTTF